MKYFIFILASLVLACLLVAFDSTPIEYAPIVQLNAGKVRGLVEKVGEKKVHFYQGIRFGLAKRFEKPTLVTSWTDIYNATEKRAQCPQNTLFNVTIEGMSFMSTSMSEDCLFLNVWRPAEVKTNLPVMFFIHGGGFAMGSIFSEFQDGRYLVAAGDVIVVSVAYRLASFGFLYGGDVPGNLGFHDQILGLKWVKANIVHFGGNPDQVTIFGASAGSFSIGSLILSPLTKGLFKRAIMQSGAPNSRLGGISKSKSLEKTVAFAKRLNCSTESIQVSVNCLKTKSVHQLIAAEKFDLLRDELFTPIYGDEVMPVAPIEALKTGKFNRNFDLMEGGCRDEGSGFVLGMFPEMRANNLTLKVIRENALYIMKMYNISNPDEGVDFYLGGLGSKPSQDELKIVISKILGDYHLVCPTVLFAEQIAKFSPKNHFYAYRLVQHLTVANSPLEHLSWQGVTHGEESMYIYAIPLHRKAEDHQMSKDLLKAWTNFAKTGHPGQMGGVMWEEAFENKERPVTRHMSLHANDYKMISGFFSKNCDGFWKSRIVHM